MAVSSKSQPISLNSHHFNTQLIKPNNLKSFHFSYILQNSHNFSIKKSHHHHSLHSPNASISSTLTTTIDHNLHIYQLCIKGQVQESIRYLRKIREFHESIEEETFVCVIRLCEYKRALDEGCFVYEFILNLTTQLSLRLGNALLSMFVRLDNLGDAWYVFGKMDERDVFSWNVLIGGYAKRGYFDEALDMYHRMLWVGFRPDVYTFPCVLRTCGGLCDRKIGREVHVHLLRLGFESDVDVNNSLITMYVKCRDVRSARLLFDGMSVRDRISWNAIISGYFENEDVLEGLRLFFLMREHDVDPDLMTMTSVISACEVIGDERLGMVVHGYVAKSEFGGDVSIDNALIQLYSRVGYLSEAEKVFNNIECKDVVSWTAMISCYEDNGLPERAVETYKLMQTEGIIPDEVTVASVLSACASLGLLDMGIKLHEFAKRSGFTTCIVVTNSLIDLYSKCNCIDKALEVFHQIPDKDVISWTSIILGLKNRNIELWKRDSCSCVKKWIGV
ncbi:hypothetical protein Leryth_023718 [Lithospermum erythrorhizon]|nr:hypothetical protein Leryth_023718 [Lithospermum erythrorhizon]